MGGKIREFSNESDRRIRSQNTLNKKYIFNKEKEKKQYEIPNNACSVKTLVIIEQVILAEILQST